MIKTIKTSGDPANLEDLQIHQDSIYKVLDVLWKMFDCFDYFADPSFPYFGEIIDLCGAPSILSPLMHIGLEFFRCGNQNPETLEQMSDLVFSIRPFINLLKNFSWDHKKMKDSLESIFAERKKTKDVPESLADLINKVLEHGQFILDFWSQEQEAVLAVNQTQFIWRLTQKICTQYNISEQKSKREYFSVVGESLLASFLLAEELDETTLSLIAIMQCFQGISIFTTLDQLNRKL